MRENSSTKQGGRFESENCHLFTQTYKNKWEIHNNFSFPQHTPHRIHSFSTPTKKPEKIVGRAKNLTTEERNVIVQFILSESKNGKPKHGRLAEAQRRFNISRSTCFRLWKSANHQQEHGLAIFSASAKPGRARNTRLLPDYDKIKGLGVSSRGSLRKMEAFLDVSKSTLHKWVKSGLLRAHSSCMKPLLTSDNKFLRLRFSLEFLELDRAMNKLRYSTMHNIVHIDEKWFYITKGNNMYYLCPDEEEPYRACQSKKFIGKIMFLCAVSRPILREDGTTLFDGKIGIFPFLKEVEAKRKSKHRDKGTIEIKAVDCITREVIKTALISEVKPAIRSKWPENASKDILIQQDNAKPHIMDSDADFRVAATSHGFNMKLIQQPPNSPDTNINDLGFFNAIQSIQQQTTCKNVQDLVNAVRAAFYQLAPTTLNKVFLTLQGCLAEIMKVKGHNKYKIPHMGKDRMIREGTLPISLDVPHELAMNTIEYLIGNGQIRGIEHLVHRLGMQQLTGIEGDGAASTSTLV